MQGTLVKYGPGASHLAFISQPAVNRAPTTAQTFKSVTVQAPRDASASSFNRHVIVVGGLTDGLMFASYVQPLAKAVTEAGWSLVQAQITSSYEGWGHGSLNQDARDLLRLCAWLVQHQSSGALVLLGHSTGCQDIIRLTQLLHQHRQQQTLSLQQQQQHQEGSSGVVDMQQGAVEGNPRSALPGDNAIPAGVDDETKEVLDSCGAAVRGRLAGAVLQAPVSDREWLSQYPDIQPLVDNARQLVSQGKGSDIVGRLDLTGGTPITAQRLVSLHDVGGDDDMFSSDLTDQHLQALLSPAGTVPVLVLASGADEAVPDQDSIPIQAQRITDAISTGGRQCVCHVISNAPHNCEGHEDVLVGHVVEFINGLQHD